MAPRDAKTELDENILTLKQMKLEICQITTKYIVNYH